MSRWVEVSTLGSLPLGKGVTVTMPGDVTIALFRTEDAVYAIDDFCPHMGAPLSQGCLDGAAVTCPWHDATFSLITGSNLNNSPAYGAAKVYNLRVEGESVQLEWPPDGGKLFIR